MKYQSAFAPYTSADVQKESWRENRTVSTSTTNRSATMSSTRTVAGHHNDHGNKGNKLTPVAIYNIWREQTPPGGCMYGAGGDKCSNILVECVRATNQPNSYTYTHTVLPPICYAYTIVYDELLYIFSAGWVAAKYRVIAIATIPSR